MIPATRIRGKSGTSAGRRLRTPERKKAPRGGAFFLLPDGNVPDGDTSERADSTHEFERFDVNPIASSFRAKPKDGCRIGHIFT